MSGVYAVACGEHTGGTQFCQRASVFGPPLPGRLHFDADPVLAAAPYEVHFHARGSAVVGQLAAASRIRDPRAQFMEDQRLQQMAALGAVQRFAQPPRQRPYDATIEQVELRMAGLLHLRARSPCGQPRADQGVHQGLEVALHGRARHGGIACQRGDVGDLAVGQCGNFQKATEGFEAPHQRLSPDLLREIGFDVSLEQVDAAGNAALAAHQRQAAEAQQVIGRRDRGQFCQRERQNQVVLPTPRGPSSRRERSGRDSRRIYIVSITTVKMLAIYTLFRGGATRQKKRPRTRQGRSRNQHSRSVAVSFHRVRAEARIDGIASSRT